MLHRLPNTFVTFLIALGCAGFAFPTPPPFPPDLGEVAGNVASPTETAPGIPSRADPNPSHLLSGKDFYLKECAVCHGPRGDGTERGMPLYKPHRVYATHITRHGRQGSRQYAIPMPAYPNTALSDRQLGQIWDYLDSLSSPTTGEQLYRSYCANCHGPDGLGGACGQPLINADGILTQSNLFTLWVRWGQNDGSYDRRGSYMPRWNRSENSDADVEKLRSYIQSLSSISEHRHLP